MCRTLAVAGFIALISCIPACTKRPISADLELIYGEAAREIGSARNPVVVIPGILGSKLQSPEMMRPVWGAFIYGAADPDTAEGARIVALPMERGVPLSGLRDEVVPTEVLDTLTLDVGLIRGVEFAAYVDILKTLAAGKYRDQTLGRAGVVDYGGLHSTCFQYAYDWRRDISEQAVALHAQILEAMEAQPEGSAKKVDVIAHSMGGLVLRYYLRYGPHPLPEDGSVPAVTWEGARYVEQAILVGTPSAGSVLSLKQLVEGTNYAALITPTYRPAVLGTMPAIFQLLPRTRHGAVVDDATGENIDVLDPAVWERYGWGLADPGQDGVLRQLLPEVRSASERREIALDHLRKTLSRTKQLFQALDAPATPPVGLELFLIAGDARPTPTVLGVRPDGSLRIREVGPGDNTVARYSALMDERMGGAYRPRLRSPIDFESVLFLSSDHIGLTKDPLFSNWVLYQLLERPRYGR